MTKFDRRARIKYLSGIAMGIVRRCGDPCWIDRGGARSKILSVRYNEMRIELSHSIADDVRTLTVRFDGKTVLLVEWTPEAVTRTSYRLGAWEAALLRYDRTPALTGRIKAET